MKYMEIRPDQLLADYIHSFWQSKNDSKQTLELTTLPDGCMEFFIRFQDGQFCSAEFVNICKGPISFTMPPNQTKMGIRLKPLAKEYLFPKHEFGTYRSTDMVILGTAPLSQQLTSDINMFSKIVSEGLISLRSAKAPDTRKIRFFQMLDTSQGDIKVSELARAGSWSERQINRYFNKQFGMSLKSYCAILKCYASYPQISSGRLFPEQNFYDQPHFIREIRKYTGTTPHRLWKNREDRFVQFQKEHSE